MYSSSIAFVAAFLPSLALSFIVNGEGNTHVGLTAKRLTCTGSDEQYCGDTCISSSDECCDHYYYCGSAYTCGHGGKCCEDDDCSVTGTYVYCELVGHLDRIMGQDCIGN